MRQKTMNAGTPTLARRRRAGTRRASAEPTPLERRRNLLAVSWVVTCACAYLGFAEAQPLAIEVILVLIVAAMMAGNVVIGRIKPSRIVSPVFAVGVAVFYSGALLAAWQLGGQGSVELLVAAIALFDLALVGLSAGELAAVALAMFLTYAVIL